MAIFNSYLNLPEGKVNHPLFWPKLFLVGQLWWSKDPESLDVRSSLQDQVPRFGTGQRLNLETARGSNHTNPTLRNPVILEFPNTSMGTKNGTAALFGDTTPPLYAPYIFFKVLKAIDQWKGWREDHIYSTWHPDFKNTKETHRFSVGPNLVPQRSDYMWLLWSPDEPCCAANFRAVAGDTGLCGTCGAWSEIAKGSGIGPPCSAKSVGRCVIVFIYVYICL